MRDTAGRKAKILGTTGDGRCRPGEPGGSRGSSASMLAFPADGRPQGEGGNTTNQGGGGKAGGWMGVSSAHGIPRPAGKAERKKYRAREGMQARGRTRAHGKNDNPKDFQTRTVCFRRNINNSTIGFRTTHPAGRFLRLMEFRVPAAVVYWKMVEGGKPVRKQADSAGPFFTPASERGRPGHSSIQTHNGPV